MDNFSEKKIFITLTTNDCESSYSTYVGYFMQTFTLIIITTLIAKYVFSSDLIQNDITDRHMISDSTVAVENIGV